MDCRDRDRLDQWLDEALRQSLVGEPRAGLEGRVLAGIAAESKRDRARRPWAWRFLTAAVAALVVLIGLWVGQNSGRAPSPAAPHGSRNSRMADPAFSVRVSRRPAVENRSRRKPALARARTEEPKREHFPSPRPLSQQEIMLASYAERFPAEAALMAREQQKFDQEVAEAQEETEQGSSHPNQ